MIAWLSPVVLALLVLAAACVIALALPLVRLCVLTLRALRHRKILTRPTDDWWPEFERQFRAYAEDSAKRRRSHPA